MLWRQIYPSHTDSSTFKHWLTWERHGRCCGKYASHFSRVCFVCLQRLLLFSLGQVLNFVPTYWNWNTGNNKFCVSIRQHHASFAQDLSFTSDSYLNILCGNDAIHTYLHCVHTVGVGPKRTEPKRVYWMQKLDVFTYIRISMGWALWLSHRYLLQPHLHSDIIGRPLHPSKMFEGS